MIKYGIPHARREGICEVEKTHAELGGGGEQELAYEKEVARHVRKLQHFARGSRFSFCAPNNRTYPVVNKHIRCISYWTWWFVVILVILSLPRWQRMNYVPWPILQFLNWQIWVAIATLREHPLQHPQQSHGKQRDFFVGQGSCSLQVAANIGT